MEATKPFQQLSSTDAFIGSKSHLDSLPSLQPGKQSRAPQKLNHILAHEGP
jgi:hypothetical protein